MDANGKAPKTIGEINMVENPKTTNDVIISISGDEKDSKFSSPNAQKEQKYKLSADSPHGLSNDSTFSAQKSVPISCPSPEIASFSPSPNRPPKIPKNERLTLQKVLSRSVYSKPKSRFGEQSVHIDGKMLEDEALVEDHVVSSWASPSYRVDSRTVSMSPKTPLISSPGGFRGVDEDEEIYKKVSSRKKLKYRKVKAKVLIEWFMFLCILGCLIISVTVDKLQEWRIWGLKIWKWCLLVLVTFSGLLVTKWLMHFIVLLIELNYLLKKKVLYFVYGLKKSVQVCIWLCLVLLTWVLIFREGVEKSHLVNWVLDFITWTIGSLLIGAFLWLLKTLLLKILASSFHVNTFFDRIQESIFHQYILFTLSGPPIMESAQMLEKQVSNASKFSAVANKGKEGKEKKKKKKKEEIDINKLHQMKRDKVSAWTMKMLVDMVSNSRLTTLSNAIDESVYEGGIEQTDKEINNEEEAIAAAYHIFINIAQPSCKYIDERDLRRFMLKEEVEVVFPLIDVAETGQIDRKTLKIDRKTLTDWVVHVYKGRKALAHALNDTKTAVKQLNKLVTGILLVIMIIVWLLLTGIATTKVLVFFSSQLVVAAFVFGNTCRTIFEAIIFVFVMHPFDVGDRCVIDGVQMIVEEMNILTTIFLKFDNEKIYYPNSVLATKPISNFYRSPDMGDAFEFSIDFKTSLEQIGTLKEKIKKYLEKNPQHWHPNHNVVVKEIENVNKIKMALFFNHTMNFHDFGEKSRRRTELVLEMKRFFEELNIRYDLLPQEVHLVDFQWKQLPTGKAPKTNGETNMVENKKTMNDVIISISEDEKDSNFSIPEAQKEQKYKLSADAPHRLSNDSTFVPSPNRPPKIPQKETPTLPKTLPMSVYSKPKSRFGEQPVYINSKMLEDEASVEDHVVSSRASSSSKVDSRTLSIRPKTPLISSPGGCRGVDEEEEIYKKVSSRKKLKYRQVKAKVLIEWFMFLCILGCLIISLTVDKLQEWRIWGLKIWKWCLLVLVTFSGLLVTKWLMDFIVLLIELNYLLKRKVLYFVYGLKKSVQVCIWFGLILATWVSIFREGVQRSRGAARVLDFITWTIGSLLIGAFLWLLKTLLLKILASSFHVNTFFDRIQRAIFHQYILFTLSGPPVMESSQQLLEKQLSNASKFRARFANKVKEGKENKKKKKKEEIDINKLHQMKQDKVSAWTMKMLVDMISNSRLTTLSNAIDESVYEGGDAQTDKEINNEEEAIAAAFHIFRNVAQPGCEYIVELDLRRFMLKEEVDVVFPLIDVAETGQIDRKTLTNWVLDVYKGREALAHALNDTKTAVKQLNKLVTGILLVIMIIVWLLLTGIATTKVLVLFSSQLVLAAFVFGNTCKTIFEAIIFVFVMHPFDVGDRCVIDGVQMIVEEMNILTTIFLRYDNERICYPNSVLATKPISNFYRSPNMGDSLEFSIDFKTSLEQIGTLKENIKKYIVKNSQHWHPNHNVVVKEIENMNKIKMALYFTHTMNFQEFGEKIRRRTELVLEMKKIFDELNIRYDLLPQEVHIVESKRTTA
ncbi:hypothetical protein BUALT_Bualt10G0130700 [Buddleja alternifolia]|uniref:Mechanosensitive ion channel MscS domain-containing protein n=1 Tax=Buddleja alternifolia TaxID=168488 RepID=A0AAV6X038_9LAMI|nr:hypothetical protein BUALT_Bualt10G0130700 [Buddleja alternifolia]